MEEIVTIDGIQYILAYDQPLTVEQRAQTIENIREQSLQPPAFNWDRIRIRPPICYLPPIWEIIFNKNLDKVANEIVMAKPSPDPWAIAKHMRDRIGLVDKLVGTGKLDARMGDVAKRHFETHLNELKEIQVKG